MRMFLIAGWCALLFVAGKAEPTPVVADSMLHELTFMTPPDTQRVRTLVNLTRAYASADNGKTFEYGSQALREAEALNFPEGITMAHNALASAFVTSAEFMQAIDHAMQGLDMAEQTGNLQEKGESYRILANTYINLGDYEQAGHYYYETIKTAHTLGNNELLTKGYCALAMWWFYAHNQKDSARFYLQRSYAMAEQGGMNYFKPHILCQFSRLTRDDDASLALSYALKGLDVARRVDNYSAQVSILADLGSLYFEAKEFGKAETSLREALALSEAKKLSIQRAGIYYGLLDLSLQKGDVGNVKRYLHAYLAARDSSITVEKSKKIAELETRFETEKKEQTIRILEQEKQIEALWREGLVVLAIFLVILGVAVYRLQRLRHKKARQLLEVQQQLNENLQQADAVRSRFFTSISHEFRTPIALILAPLEEKIKSPTLATKDREDLMLVMRNANRLADLVNQILDLSKLEAGHMTLERRNGSLVKFLGPLLASFESLAQNRDIHFNYALSIPQTLFAFDPDKLEKIVANLLSNAFKFTPAEGKIQVHIQFDGESSSLLIHIADTGKGIPEVDMPHVFSPFYQSGKTEDTSLPGTGLGLALVHELVEVYGGSVSLRSRVNKGTSVDVLLPIALAAAGAVDEVRMPAMVLPGHVVPDVAAVPGGDEFTETLLIVEDNQELRRFIGDHFRSAFNICTAANGREALAIAFERIPSLIISDVMMPEMDGVEFLKHMKEDERTNHIPVILLTAKVGQTEKIAALQLGTDEYLAKPFSISELEARVMSIIDNRKRLAAHFRKTIEHGIQRAMPTAQLPVPPNMHEKFIEKMTDCICRNLGDSSFGVEALAEEMCLSRTQLFRKVKMMLDTSPSDIINDLRLQHAAKMIANKSDTLAQIAYAVGFTEQSYFAKRFRKKYGVSPREYAERKSA